MLICSVGDVPSGPRKLLGYQSTKPKHLKGKKKYFLVFVAKLFLFVAFQAIVFHDRLQSSRVPCPDLTSPCIFKLGREK